MTYRFYSIHLFLFNLTAQIILLYIVVKYLFKPQLTELTSASYFQRWRFWPVQATIRTFSAISSVASSSGVSRHTDSSVIRDPDHTPDSSPSSGAMTNMSDRDARPWPSHPLIKTGPMGWFSEPRPDGFSRQRFDNMCLIWNEKHYVTNIHSLYCINWYNIIKRTPVQDLFYYININIGIIISVPIFFFVFIVWQLNIIIMHHCTLPNTSLQNLNHSTMLSNNI